MRHQVPGRVHTWPRATCSSCNTCHTWSIFLPDIYGEHTSNVEVISGEGGCRSSSFQLPRSGIKAWASIPSLCSTERMEFRASGILGPKPDHQYCHALFVCFIPSQLYSCFIDLFYFHYLFIYSFNYLGQATFTYHIHIHKEFTLSDVKTE